MTDKNSNLIRKKDIGKAFGSLGGLATRKKYGRKHFKELARIRWAKEKAKKEEKNSEAK